MPAGQAIRQPALRAFEPDSPESGLDLRVERLTLQSVSPSGEAQILDRGEVAIDPSVGRDESEVPPIRPPDLARVGPNRPSQGLEQRTTCRNRRPRRRGDCCLPNIES